MKKFLIGLAAAIVIIVAAAFAVPRFVSLDAYKTRIAALVKDETGRDLRIAGPVRFSLLPSLALEANDVSLSNPPGASAPNMIQLKTLALELRLLPLLHGAVEIDEFKLVQPAIALEIDKEGRPNWVFTTVKPAAKPAPPSATAPAAPAPTSSGRLPQISFADVSIVDGRASYLDQRTGKTRQLSDVNMTLSLPGGGQPFTARGSATWNGEKAAITMQVDRPDLLREGGTSAFAMTLASAPIKFDFKGKATGATLAKLTGGADLSIPSVRNLLKWLDVSFNPPGSGFGQLTLTGQVDIAGPKIAFTNAVITLDAIKGSGGIAFDSSGARPYFSGRLDIDKLDVNPYLPPASGKASSAAPTGRPAPSNAAPGTAPAVAPSAAKAGGWSDAPIDLSPLKVADADFALSANSIAYRKIAIGRSTLSLHLKNGRLEADLGEMALYQGSGKGKVTVDGSGATPTVAAAFDLSGIAIQPLLRDAAGFDRLSGTGRFALDVSGHGRSQRDLIGSLNGKGSLNLANGALSGVDLIGYMKSAVSSAAGGQSLGNETPFGALSATYTIVNGILHNSDLKLTSPELPMTGAGTVDLPRRQVDYRVTPSVAGVLAVPVAITGPWDDLHYRPDLSGIAKGVIQEPGKAIEQLKKGGSGASQFLKNLLGK